MKNFIQRAITGLIFVAVLAGCIIGSPLSFGILFCLISAMATAEFCQLVNSQEGVKVNRAICMLGSITLFLCFFYYGMNPVQTNIFIPYLIFAPKGNSDNFASLKCCNPNGIAFVIGTRPSNW